ncbi:hydroxyproline O-arabinosyltransferase 1-like [Senna tora]|uniref:Hydroxyproline O-arabinosyltransferase 1-like n=1 Tax=Senna tora TaxID=362788 RepID=A0A835C7I6_9FABA|nr:hydroxyproline O-arabinosyltransferase 1-like [Senna tora]
MERVKVFLWSLAHEKIMTNHERVKTNFTDQDRCPRCNARFEMTCHAIRDCTLRNKAVFNNIHGKEDDVILGVNKLIYGLISASLISSNVAVANSSLEAHYIKWNPPDGNALKLNVDGSYWSHTCLISCGGVLRDSHGLQIARDLNPECLVVETDNLSVIKFVKEGVDEHHPLSPLILDIRNMIDFKNGFIVLNRPWAFVQWLKEADIKEDYILMAEPDHIIVKPIPNLSREGLGAAFPFFYIEPKKYESVLRKFYPVESGPITNIDPIGNSPVIFGKEYLRKIAPSWMNVSIAMKKDPEADKAFGWVLEMYAYAVASAIHGVGNILYKEFTIQVFFSFLFLSHSQFIVIDVVQKISRFTD